MLYIVNPQLLLSKNKYEDYKIKYADYDNVMLFHCPTAYCDYFTK